MPRAAAWPRAQSGHTDGWRPPVLALAADLDFTPASLSFLSHHVKEVRALPPGSTSRGHQSQRLTLAHATQPRQAAPLCQGAQEGTFLAWG